jgi:hypothetical protein
MCRLACGHLSSVLTLHVALCTVKPKKSSNGFGIRGTMRSRVGHRHRQRDPCSWLRVVWRVEASRLGHRGRPPRPPSAGRAAQGVRRRGRAWTGRRVSAGFVGPALLMSGSPLSPVAPTTSRGEIGGHNAPPVHWRSSISRRSSGWCTHQAQRAPALWPCCSGHSGFGQGPDPSGMSHRGQRCMAPPSVPAPPRRRTGCGARPRVSLVQNLVAVGMARLLLLWAVALLCSPALRLYGTNSVPPAAPAGRPGCGHHGVPHGREDPRPSGVLAVCRASPQTPVYYRVDNITMIPGQCLQDAKRGRVPLANG